MHTHPLLTLALALPLAGALSLSSAPAQETATHAAVPQPAADLSRFPAEQVEAARDYIALLRDTERILADETMGDEASEQATLAALQALEARWEAVGKPLRRMSSRRRGDIMAALGFRADSADKELPHMSICIGLDGVGVDEYSATAMLAKQLHNNIRPPFNLPAEECAPALLQVLADLEAALQREGLTADEHAEALRYHRERLLYLAHPLYRIEHWGEGYAREAGQMLRATPGAVERIEAHLALMKAGEALESEAPTVVQEHGHYEHAVRDLFVHRMPGLTEEGRQELAGIRAFLQEYPQVLLGELHSVDLDAPMPYLQTGWTGQYHSYELDLTTEAARDCFRALDKTHDLAFEGCYVMLAGELHKGQGGEGDKVSVHALRPTPGAYTAIHRVLAEQPELRERVLNLAEADIEEGE